jgi:tetratricopeptide (TPR) repeat protein
MGTLEAYTQSAKPAKEKLDQAELLKLGDTAFDNEDFERALDYYHRVTVLDGQNAAAWAALAMTYYNMDFPREAWRSYKLALQADPENTATLWYAAEFLYNMEDYVLAKALLDRYVERETDADRLAEAKDMLVEAERELAARGADESAVERRHGPADEEDEDEDDELPEGFEYEDEDKADDVGDEDFDDDLSDGFEDDEASFVATLTLQLTGYDAECDNCSTRIPLDAPYCYVCLAPHFYDES